MKYVKKPGCLSSPSLWPHSPQLSTIQRRKTRSDPINLQDLNLYQGALCPFFVFHLCVLILLLLEQTLYTFHLGTNWGAPALITLMLIERTWLDTFTWTNWTRWVVPHSKTGLALHNAEFKLHAHLTSPNSSTGLAYCVRHVLFYMHGPCFVNVKKRYMFAFFHIAICMVSAHFCMHVQLNVRNTIHFHQPFFFVCFSQ